MRPEKKSRLRTTMPLKRSAQFIARMYMEPRWNISVAEEQRQFCAFPDVLGSPLGFIAETKEELDHLTLSFLTVNRHIVGLHVIHTRICRLCSKRTRLVALRYEYELKPQDGNWEGRKGFSPWIPDFPDLAISHATSTTNPLPALKLPPTENTFKATLTII